MVHNRQICALITARNGSVGVVKKNLQKLGGKTLVEIATNLALGAKLEVIISTDIPEVINGKHNRKVVIYNRPPALCDNNVSIEDVIKDVIRNKRIEGDVVLLQPTSPLREAKQLKAIIELYYQKMPSLCLSATVEDSSVLKSYVLNGDSYESINKKEYLFKNRQELPKVFRPNGAFYIFNAKRFLNKGFDTQNVEIFEMNKLTSIDIDTYEDLEKIRKLEID